MNETMEDKEETIEQNGDAETTDKKKKKKKKKPSKEVLQKKKEKKKYDLEDQYKNVDLPSFAVVDTINGPFPNSYHQINIPGNIGKAADGNKKWTKTKRGIERVASQKTWRVSYWSEGGNKVKTYPKKLSKATIRPFCNSNHQSTIAKNI